MSAQHNPSENALARAFPVLVAMMIKARAADPEECECEDCTARAAVTLRAERDAQNLTLRDFWWARLQNEHAPLGAMIVTQSRSSYPMVPLSAWHPIRAEHYGSACVKAAAEYHATHSKG